MWEWLGDDILVFCLHVFALFSDICYTCGSEQTARWDGWLKHFQTPHAPHFCWPLTKTSNQDFHDACWRSRPAPLLVDITYAGTRTQRLLLIILPLHWGYLYTPVQAIVGFIPLLKPKCKYTRFEGWNWIIQMHFFSFVGRQSGILQCLTEHSGCKHTFCLAFNASQILNDNRCSDKHPKKMWRWPGQCKDYSCHLKPVGGIYNLAYIPLYSPLFLQFRFNEYK